jgi:RNase P/RNase MRP subunit POP5
MYSLLKSKRPKKRYIVVHIQPEQDGLVITKPDLIGVIKFILNRNNRNNKKKFEFQTPPWVITMENNYGLVRCDHRDKDQAIDFLNSITELVHREPDSVEDRNGFKVKIKLTTLGTSGTIKSARKKYFKGKYIDNLG